MSRTLCYLTISLVTLFLPRIFPVPYQHFFSTYYAPGGPQCDRSCGPTTVRWSFTYSTQVAYVPLFSHFTYPTQVAYVPLSSHFTYPTKVACVPLSSHFIYPTKVACVPLSSQFTHPTQVAYVPLSSQFTHPTQVACVPLFSHFHFIDYLLWSYVCIYLCKGYVRCVDASIVWYVKYGMKNMV